MAELNRQLNAFQDEFQKKLFDLGSEMHRQIKEEGDIFRKQWKGNHDRMYVYTSFQINTLITDTLLSRRV
jgi:hypothetical protein